jgi:hypothetical protein
MIEPFVVEGPGFKVRFDVQLGFLRAYVHEGEDSLDVSIAMWQMLAQHCRAHGAKRLLVLEDLSGTVADEDVPRVIEAMVEAGLGDVRVSFVELQGHDRGNEQGEILGLEHGLAIHVANSEHSARHWLLYGE